jgi:hypothetical protein
MQSRARIAADHIQLSLSASPATSIRATRLVAVRTLAFLMPKRRLSDQTGDVGEKTIDLLFTREFGWSYHQFGNKRAGIDGEVEIVEDGDELSGRLLAVQVRSGASYFARTTASGIIYEGNQDELDYWLRYSLPVVLVLYNPDADVAYWTAITDDVVESTGKGWKTVVPFKHTLTSDWKNELAALADVPLATQRLRQLSMHNGLMTFIAEGGSIGISATVWTNKVVPRMSMYMHFTDPTGATTNHFEWAVHRPGGWPSGFLEERFPWADVTVTVEGHEDPDDLYEALAQDYGHRLLDIDWEDLLAEKNIEGWEFKASLRLGELGRSFLQVDRFLGAAD